MKQIINIIFLTFYCSIILSQNLIPNNSFEQYNNCPDQASRILYAFPWFQSGTGSSDYYNACDITPSIAPPYSPEAGVPNNWIGKQNARTGLGYAGFCVFAGQNWSLPNYREYIEIRLIDSLEVGKKYCIQFYVSLADSSTFATDDIGAYISSDSIYSNNYYNLPYVPQIYNPKGNIIKDTSNWTLISDFFIAQGGEKFITIGGFSNDTIIDTTIVINGGTFDLAYYYIDDISIKLCDSTTGITEPKNKNFSINIFPNPFSSTAILKSNSSLVNITLCITNILGQTIREIKDINGESFIINRENLRNGLYFIEIREKDKIITTKKIFISD